MVQWLSSHPGTVASYHESQAVALGHLTRFKRKNQQRKMQQLWGFDQTSREYHGDIIGIYNEIQDLIGI